MKIIFIVDDNDTNLLIAKNVLDGIYETYTLPSAARMFKLLKKITPDLILLDVDMPKMDGFEAMQALKSNERLKAIPVAFLTAKQDPESEIRGFEMGAIDFINKPFSPPVLIKRIETYIEIDKLNEESQRDLRETHYATINGIADMVENRDQLTGGHIERTQVYLKILIDEIVRTGLYKDEIADWDIGLLLLSAQLHDVGKIAISDLILKKPNKLNDEEFAQMKEHCTNGVQIIDRIIGKTKNNKFLIHARKFAGCHHEKWNGTGYPKGLSGENIPLEGRLMAIVDVYDALVSERPYKKPFAHKQAVKIIKNESGASFDPKIVGVFLNVADDFCAEFINMKNKIDMDHIMPKKDG